MEVLTNKRVYLSGAMEHGLTINWRNEPIRILQNEFKLTVFDPFSDEKQQWKPSLEQARKDKDFDKMREIAKKFVRKDLSLVSRADLLIAYLPYKVPTVGTIHEIVNGVNDKKPVLLICEEGREMIPFWLYGFVAVEFMFNSWSGLYEYLREVNAGKHKDNDRWQFIYGMV